MTLKWGELDFGLSAKFSIAVLVPVRRQRSQAVEAFLPKEKHKPKLAASARAWHHAECLLFC